VPACAGRRRQGLVARLVEGGSIAVIGYFMRPMGAGLRALFGVAGILALIPSGAFPGAVVTDVIGAALGAALIAREIWLVRLRAKVRPALP